MIIIKIITLKMHYKINKLLVKITFIFEIPAVMQFIAENLIKLLEGDACNGIRQFGRCSIASSCAQVTCAANFSRQPVMLTMTIQRCNEPVTITTKLKVKGN